VARREVHVPSYGFLEMPAGNNRTIKIEVLKRVYGVRHSEIETRALTYVRGNEEIRVLDPILLLKAKTENVVHLRQDEPGFERQDEKHMRMLVLCVCAFLRELISGVTKGNVLARDCLTFHQDFCEFALTRTAQKAVMMYAVDWALAIPMKELNKCHDPKMKSFAQKQLPRWHEKIEKGRCAGQKK